ncbi:MAG: DUF1173 domain-containing protein [Vitreoscilla sp.]|jgi:hypothetical protein|nr:DUF1173 domain-containing protein [Vitreoscilla sp.]
METQRLVIAGRIWVTDDPQLQEALARVHDTPERPRCLCVPGGIEMYVARHTLFVVKRMPDTGSRHDTTCPSYEPDAQQSGLGELIGGAVVEREPGRVELRVDFPWARISGRSVARAEARDAGEVGATPRSMSLRALMHYLFERAGFNRWSPAMEGRRNQGVLHKYLLEAARGVTVKGLTLSDRLYVPEPFSETGRADAARRRREKLSVLHPGDGQQPLALLLGEYKANEPCTAGRRVWIKHLPDVPLLVSGKTWERLEKRYATIFDARDADAGHRVHVVVAALLRARREYTYEIDAASMMLTNETWIPVEGVHELPLLRALIEQRRRFVKPLRYDAKTAAGFPNALLLDVGAVPAPLHVVSAFIDLKEQRAKQRATADAGDGAWVWSTAHCMPAFPQAVQSDRGRPDVGSVGAD